MARRRLTDLLREEAQKTTEETVEIIEVTAQPISDATSEGTVNSGLNNLPELEGALAHLNHDLDAAEQRETNLQEQIDYLHADLKAQKQLVQQLQTDLKQAQQAQAELEQTKQVILQLSEVNTKLTQEKVQLVAEIASLKQAKPAAIQPKSAIIAAPQPHDYRSQRSGLRPLPHHSIHPHVAADRSNKLDLGWAD